MKSLIFVCDLEGVLTDNSQRLHLMKSGLWDEYEKAFEEDHFNNYFCEIFSTISSTDLSVVWTGRYEKFRKRTEELLSERGIAPDEILMRPNIDNMPKTKEVDFKLGLLETLYQKWPLEEYSYIFLEDRDDVVEALRNAGHECWQVRNGQIG